MVFSPSPPPQHRQSLLLSLGTFLFALTVGIGEGACLATFFAQTYPQLYCCRAITGFALGGALPLIYSILGDLYAATDRHFANAVVGIGTGAGISVGQGVAGFLGPTMGWRLPFLVISLPALLCAALVLFTVRDPERGSMEEAVLQHGMECGDVPACFPVEMEPLQEATRTPSLCVDVEALTTSHSKTNTSNHDRDDNMPGFLIYWRTFEGLITTPTVVLTLFQGAPGCIPWGIVNSFLNDFLSENRGMSVEVCQQFVIWIPIAMKLFPQPLRCLCC